jgi:bifunctional DNA-binding transcriptional regulator/antitoxin component of YhaV-PrlF toxin-antitoxin module
MKTLANQTIIRKNSIGQYRATIPKSIAESLELSDKPTIFNVENENKDIIVLKKQKNDTNERTD